jgi:hypothetical protein
MWKQRSFREQHMGDEANGGAGGSGEAQVDAGASADEGAGDGDRQDSEILASREGMGADDGGEHEEVVITLGDEAPPNEEDEQLRAAPTWVKDLRKQSREKDKRIRELETAMAARETAAASKTEDVGPEPSLQDEDVDFDEAKFKAKWSAWSKRKEAAEAKVAEARKEQEAAQTAWQERLKSYQTAKTTLKVPDFEDAEAVVLGTLSEQQQGIIVHGAKNHAALIYALGKNPAQLQKLAAIKDPIQYAFEASRLEAQLKVQPRKTAPAPERKVSGSAGGATGVDNQLERLRAEADRTGDRSKVAAYLRKQQQAA